jgi:hypothetical protein
MSKRSPSRHRDALALVMVTSALFSQGCYERVVRTRGFGADQYNVAEPYQENSKMDDWIFGQRPTKNNSRLGNSPRASE